MAHKHHPDDTDLRFFANMIHHAFTQTREGATTRHMFSMLIDRSAVIGPLKLLGLSPLREIKTDKVGDQYVSIPFPGSDLVVWPFTILGSPLEHLRNMTLPRGAVALGIALETTVKLVPCDEQKRPVGLLDDVEGAPAYGTLAVGRGGTKVSLINLKGLDEIHEEQPTGELVLRMREVIGRSER